MTQKTVIVNYISVLNMATPSSQGPWSSFCWSSGIYWQVSLCFSGDALVTWLLEPHTSIAHWLPTSLATSNTFDGFFSCLVFMGRQSQNKIRILQPQWGNRENEMNVYMSPSWDLLKNMFSVRIPKGWQMLPNRSIIKDS